MGALAILERLGLRVARHWPLVFFGMATFLFVRNDPRAWPLGPAGFWESFSLPDVLQHRTFVLLIVAFGVFEWMVRTERLAVRPWAYVFPLLCAVGGGLLLTHSHAMFNLKDEFLAEVTHAPLGILGAVIAVLLRSLTNDVFFQVGLLTTMGLTAKNAILIVEFAEQAERNGQNAREAALAAAGLRLRPIVMTSFAFVFGVVPLALSSGAGAKSRVEIGTTVVGGMLTGTVLAIYYVPLFFVLLRTMLRGRRQHTQSSASPNTPHTELA